MRSLKKIFTTKTILLFGIAVLIAGISLFALSLYSPSSSYRPVDIKSAQIKDKALEGRVVDGEDADPSDTVLSTTSKLVYQTEPLETNNKTTTAVYTTWNQTGEGVTAEARVFDGQKWSDWYDATTDKDERPDHAPENQRGAFIAGQNIQKIEYRFTLESARDGDALTTVDLSDSSTEVIDAGRGLLSNKDDLLSEAKNAFGFNNTAHARGAGPNIISREAWGCPEATNPEWQPEYAKVNRTVIHHTAVIPGTDSAAAVRSIWQYHAKSLGWGDIGYNYLVDQTGRVFEGRYSDKEYAENHNVDVIGGHTYGNNVGTVGIAALGDFNKDSPTANLIHSMGEMAAYKMGPYGLNPAGGETYGGNLLGHRDLGQTACPGANLYANLQTIRNVASALYQKYYIPKYSWQYMNQYSYTDNARTQLINLNTARLTPGQKIYLTLHAKNTGTEPWVKGSETAPIRLGTSRPNDRVSAYCDEGWPGCTRAADITEPVVYPGQVGSFIFSVTVPNNTSLSSRTQLEYFTPLAEKITWFNDPGQYWPFNLPAAYEWQHVGQSAYLDEAQTIPIDLMTTPIKPGTKVYLKLEAKNIGGDIWRNDTSTPVKLGTNNPRDRMSVFCDNSRWGGCNRAATVQKTTSPGEIGIFSFPVIAPANPSSQTVTYKEYFTPVAEGKTWLNNPGQYWQISVLPNGS